MYGYCFNADILHTDTETLSCTPVKLSSAIVAAEQVDETLERLQSDAEFRAEYEGLWGRQRTYPLWQYQTEAEELAAAAASGAGQVRFHGLRGTLCAWKLLISYLADAIKSRVVLCSWVSRLVTA